MTKHESPDRAHMEQAIAEMQRSSGRGPKVVRISAIVDACFRLIVDGKSVLPLTRWGGTQVLG